ncbi:hypothetical protein ACYULU_05020 [Breznakiellaceae bacterium SP9]
MSIMTQDMLIEEVKRVRDPGAIDALYSYTLFLVSDFAKTGVPQTKTVSKTHSWSDIVPI